MHDLEFLPDWYLQIRRRRRLLLTQTWSTLLLVAGLALWLCLADRNLSSAQTALACVKGQLSQVGSQIQQMDRLETLRRQLRQQADVLSKLGLHVESGRMIGALADALPSDVSLLNLMLEVDEKPVVLSGIQRAALKDPNATPMDRRLRVRLQGVAPSDVELATLLTALSKVRFFEGVTPVYSRDRREQGHLLRDFEVKFYVNLNSPQPEGQ